LVFVSSDYLWCRPVPPGLQEALDHPQHGILTRALCVGPEVELDSATHRAEEGDRLLVYTDGLSNEVPSDEIASLMAVTEDL
jgi:PPM family protein phosphatase